MSTNRKFEFSRLWRWTIEMYSFCRSVYIWMALIIPSDWGSKYRYDRLYTGSLPAIVLLLVTAVICWKRHREHSMFGFAICALWAIWAALPRL